MTLRKVATKKIKPVDALANARENLNWLQNCVNTGNWDRARHYAELAIKCAVEALPNANQKSQVAIDLADIAYYADSGPSLSRSELQGLAKLVAA